MRAGTWGLAALAFFPSLAWAAAPGQIELDDATRARCLAVLREGFHSGEFWPSMHAAEGLTEAGHGAEVLHALAPKLPEETDAQHRCGLARELVRAGDRAKTRILLEELARADPYGHVHASESMYKVWQIGGGVLLRQAAARRENPRLSVMASAALARWGSPEALARLRGLLSHEDHEIARITAWVLARVGDASDLPALRAGAKRFNEALSVAYFEHAMAALGDPEGVKALARNLDHDDPMVRVYAAEFAPDARALQARNALQRHLHDDNLDVRIRSAQALLMLARPAPPARGKAIVRDVFPATPANPRYSEGSVISLRDGRLLYATTEFIGSGSDFAKARLIAAESNDEGATWGPRRVLQENVGQNNVMSVTLRRLDPKAVHDGPIGMFYLVKNSFTDLQVYLRISQDEAATFGDPIRVTADSGYHVLNNDRVTILESGRIVVPVASTADVQHGGVFAASSWLSDDQGKTWRRSRNTITYAKRGAMEPEVLELSPGRLLMHIRTQSGHVAMSESDDGGESWSEARDWGVRAPEAPSTLRRVPSTGDLLLVWNDTFRGGADHGGKRTPLTSALSSDGGETWTHRRDVEANPKQTYAYTSILFDRGRAIMTYYVSDEQTGRLSSRFRSLPIHWLYEKP